MKYRNTDASDVVDDVLTSLKPKQVILYIYMVITRHTKSESNASSAQDTKAKYLVTPLHTRMKLKISRPPVFYLHVLLPLLTKVSTYAIWSFRSTNQSRGWGMSDQSGPSISLVSWQQQASVLERIATKR